MNKFYFYSFYNIKKWINQYQFYDETKPSVEFVKNGIILPPINPLETEIAVYEAGGVVREDFSFVENSAYTRGRKEFWENPITKGYIPKEYKYCDEEVMYAGAAFEHWGHFLTEITNRLYWFLENREKYPNLKLAFIQYINPDFDFKNTYKEFLEMLGITNNDYIFVTKPTKFKMVIVPEYSVMLGNKYKKEFIKIFDEIIKQVKPANCKKNIFIIKQSNFSC
ncbi:DUF563 domain-containing protein [bacterium]|nr:DUF563 domain-containing protein [bacterium]